MNHHLLRAALAAGVFGLALGGCGALGPSAPTEIYQATLSGAQEVPPNTSGATGVAEVQLDRPTNTIRWKVTYTGLSGPATGAHIHGPAGPGQSAPVLVPFSNVATPPIEGQAPLTPTQVAELADGKMYANVHTAAFPGGEIRGQLLPRR